ncbi:T9SS type A sorting domain-containing protein [Rhodohalobacter halophilus]|uniref:T9SS type A sorting domain-containing protein n=1 Tax=Rhodohalobacter halophilus TaxID=1812810 RepID=UPI00083F7CAF|nr:T9SS type A sorting domain-containing protein [Rhodohalobacter halophilus]
MIKGYRKTELSERSFKVGIFSIALLFTAVFTVHAQDTIPQTEEFILAPAPEMGQICKLPPTDINRNYFKKAEERYRKMADNEVRSANFEITYVNSCSDGSEWPSQAQNAFEYAMGIWETYLQSEIPIRIEASWTQRDENVLGSAGPTLISRPQNGEPDTWYSIAQASAMSGVDQLEGNQFGEEHDIVINMNCNFSDWYFGTDAQTPQGFIDFVTVVLHEIGHGIGFIGTMGVNEDAQTGSYGLGDNNWPFIYDRFTEDGLGNELLNTNVFPNPSVELYRALTGQRSGVYFTGNDARGVFSGQRVPLYAPSEWNGGSSYSHLDQATFSQQQNLESALMRPRIDRQFAVHSPGPVFCGMLSDWGWPLGSSCLELVGAESEIFVDSQYTVDGLDFGVTNVGERVERTFEIENLATAEDPLSYSINIDNDNFVISPAGLASGSVDPGESVMVTVRYIPSRDRIHEGTIRISHNASNAASPISISLKGEALRADEIARLEDNYPNPFNPTTTIPYVLPETSDVRLDIYNVSGQLVQTLVNTQQGEGRYNLQFDAANLASGMYFYRLIVNDNVFVKRLLLVK